MLHTAESKQQKQTKKHLTSSRSIFWVFLLLLIVFIVIGYFTTTSLVRFYYNERVNESTSLAKAYLRSVQSGIEAEQAILSQMDKRLEVASITVAKYPGLLTDEVLAEMAENLSVDFIYIYDDELKIINSSIGENIGWISEPGHGTYEFAHSSLDFFNEGIREGALTGTLYKYAYRKLEHGIIVQVGLRATTIEELQKRFNPQHIIDLIWDDAQVAKLLYLDQDFTVVAATDEPLVGQKLTSNELQLPSSAEYTITRTVWGDQSYMTLHFPVLVEEGKTQSLLVYYPTSLMEANIRRAALYIGLTILAIFILTILLLNQTIQRNRRMYSFAFFDDETGLPNLHNFLTTHGRNKNTPITALAVEISNLTQLLLTFGVEHSKRVHEEMATALNSLFANRIEVNVYALPWSRFLVLFHSIVQMDTLSIIDEIFLLRRRTGALANIDIRIGYAIRENEQLESDTLLKHALIALNATTHAEPVAHFSHTLEQELHRQDTIEETLQRKIRGEIHPLTLVFQPIVEIHTKALVGFEALARLNCPILGPVPPNEFIPLAEQRHLIIPLGWQILALVCDFIKKGLKQGVEMVPIGVNISVIQIMEESFVPTVEAILNHKKIPRGLIQFELTESIFAQDLTFVAKQMDRLMELGIAVAIDDFGTGYSALSRLNQISFDSIKIPKEFTDRLEIQESADLVTDIISLAHHLGKEVIVEGVECEDQLADLVLMGADYIQGYVISPPFEDAKLFDYIQEATIIQKRYRHLTPNLQSHPSEQ